MGISVVLRAFCFDGFDVEKEFSLFFPFFPPFPPPSFLHQLQLLERLFGLCRRCWEWKIC